MSDLPVTHKEEKNFQFREWLPLFMVQYLLELVFGVPDHNLVLLV